MPVFVVYDSFTFFQYSFSLRFMRRIFFYTLSSLHYANNYILYTS